MPFNQIRKLVIFNLSFFLAEDHFEARKAILNYLGIRTEIKSSKLIIGEYGPMSRSGVYRVVEKDSKASGVNATPHTLRHQFCHDFLAAGETISTVTELCRA